MNWAFRIDKRFRVPEGTLGSPFLNSKDSMSGLPFELFDGFSLAARTIEPGTKSRIHIMPFVIQVNFARGGTLEARMKGPEDMEPYSLTLATDKAVLTERGTFFQLINDRNTPCEVLNIVSPAYLFEMSNGRVVYDDSVVLKESGDELKAFGWEPSNHLPSREERNESLASLELKSGNK